ARRVARDNTVGNHYHCHSNGPVPTHVRVSLTVHVDQAGVVFRAGRRSEEDTEHVVVAPRLPHKGCTNPIVMLGQEATLLKNGGTDRVRNAIVHDTQWLTFSMGVNNIKNIGGAHHWGESPTGCGHFAGGSKKYRAQWSGPAQR